MEKSKHSRFAERIRTRIWEETADTENPYLATSARCHGYALGELIARCDYAEMLFLMLRGELPEAPRAELLRRFLVAFSNPGPRHPATRAVMNAAASRTANADLLPIGLTILGGSHLGSSEVEASARFIGRSLRLDPEQLAGEMLDRNSRAAEPNGDLRIAPGFGTVFGSVDPYAQYLLNAILEGLPETRALDWISRFSRRLEDGGCGCLVPGVAAAVGVELGFAARVSGILYQLACLPGLAAHAIEMAGRGIEAMPFLPDSACEFIAPDVPDGELP